MIIVFSLFQFYAKQLFKRLTVKLRANYAKSAGNGSRALTNVALAGNVVKV